MITNQNLIRPMGCFKVEQRTKDGMFNATALLRQWNETMGMKKEMKDFFVNDSTKEFINALLEDVENQAVLNRGNSPKLEDVENQAVLNTPKKGELENVENQAVLNNAKKRDVEKIIKTSKGKYGGTWIHPYLFIKFAMWLNPRFELQVIKFVHDQLLAYRDDAGEAYKELSTAIYQLVSKDKMRESIKEVGRALNFIVWNKHEEEMRNKQADEKKLKELFELERKVASLVSEGFIRSFKDLMNYLRMLWLKKYEPKEFRKVA